MMQVRTHRRFIVGRAWRCNQAVVAALVVSALIGGVTAAGANAAAKHVNIAFIGYVYGNTTSDAMQTAAIAEAKKLGATVTPFNGEFSPSVQLQDCLDAVTSGKYQAIMVGAVVGSAITPCAQQAKAQDVKLVAIGTVIGTNAASAASSPPGVVSTVWQPLSSFFGDTAVEAGEACKGIDPCNVVELSAGQDVPSIEAAFQATWKRVRAENPNIHVVADPDGGLAVTTGQAAMQDVLSKGVKFNVLVATGTESMQGALLALKAAKISYGIGKKQLRVVTTGGVTSQIAGVKAGKLWSSTLSLPATDGQVATLVADEAALGKPVQKQYNTTTIAHLPLAIDQTNKDQYKSFKAQYS